MSDGTVITIHMTPEEKAAADAAQAEKDRQDAEFETSLEGLSDEEKETKRQERQYSDTEIELDKQLKEELARGADPVKAKQAFEEREARRKATEEADAAVQQGKDLDKPLTRRDIAEIEQRAYQRMQQDQATGIARTLTSSSKEADLLLATWKNRSFPATLSLQDQLEECYAIVNRKKIMGERNEAMRVARNKGNVRDTAADTHRDTQVAGEPKLSDADKTALTAAGFVWDGNKRLFKKSLKGGKMWLYRDPKSGLTFTSVA